MTEEKKEKTLRTSITNNNDGESMDLEQSFRLANEALEKAIETNNIENAVEMIGSVADKSLYHSSLKSILLILHAGLTLTRDNLETAVKSTEQTERLSNKYRRNGFIDSVKKMFRTPNYDKYSDTEVLAELTYAKFLGMSAILCALEANSVFSLIRIAYRLRLTVNAFRECRLIWKTRTRWESDVTKDHFDAGIRLANGIQHLFISHTPPKLLKIVNFLGYKGVASRAFEELQRAAFEIQGGISSLAAEVVLLYYWIIIQPHISLGPKHSSFSQKILERRLSRFPKSLLYRLLKAKLTETSGDIDKAIELYKDCLVNDTLDISHKIFHIHLTYCHALKREWDEAIEHMKLARLQSRHSPAILCNIEAILCYAKSVDDNDPEMKKRASELFRAIPEMRVRYLGKTITIEKMAVELSNEYFRNNETLVLPEMETLYHSNFLYFIKNNPILLNKHLEVVNKTLDSYEEEFKSGECVDHYLTALFFKGVVLKLLGQLDEAQHCFETITTEESSITDRFYQIVPQSLHELAVIEMYRNNYDEAKELFNRVIKDYSGYLTENFVHLRAYAGLRDLGVNTDKQEINDSERMKAYGKEWLQELEVDDHSYERVLEKEKLVLK